MPSPPAAMFLSRPLGGFYRKPTGHWVGSTGNRRAPELQDYISVYVPSCMYLWLLVTLGVLGNTSGASGSKDPMGPPTT
jgi:hypothetical protein